MLAPVILWFRQDLRLEDNPALEAALSAAAPVLPLFILDDDERASWRLGAASRWWLHYSLISLDAALRRLGSRLYVARGSAQEVLEGIIRDTGAKAVFWNRCYDLRTIERDRLIKEQLQSRGVEGRSFNGSLLFEPPTVANKQGKPFQVFTPFWRHCLEKLDRSPLPIRLGMKRLPPAPVWTGAVPLDALELLPEKDWASAFPDRWQPGEQGAQQRLADFFSRRLADYDRNRDFPGEEGTSCFSPHLHFGEIGPRQLLAALHGGAKCSGVFPANKGEQRFLAELGWREFAYHLLYHFPKTPERPLRPTFERFPWAEDPDGIKFRAWKQGLTGYPIVDAGMRQLWAEGWMHNRVRMITASFLVKQLRLPWQQGAAWFWETLVDADLASNTMGWQWSAGCGADAAPYFRIFNPVLQGEKFDPEGVYVRRWIPELADIPAKWIHRPWEAPDFCRHDVAAYPAPIVDHVRARAEALGALRSMPR